MKKQLTAAISGLALSLTVLAGASGVTPTTSVTWRTLGNTVGADGRDHYTQRIVVRGDTGFPRLGFNMFARTMKAVNPADTIVEIFPGYYYIASPRFAAATDSVIVDIDVHAPFHIKAYAPDGFHVINADGTTRPVTYTRERITRRGQWATGRRDPMPYGAAVYEANERRATDWTPGVYDVIPSYKKVTGLPGSSRITLGKTPVVREALTPDNPEYYRITVRNDSLIVATAADNIESVLLSFIVNVLEPNAGRPLPNAVIEDWPDLPWRGQHIDIARNYQTPETMRDILYLLKAHRLNRLHFHVFDDEAWRVEIPGLPELTDVASRRGYSDHGENDYLYQIFAGDGNPSTVGNSANGYWTRDQYIRFIQDAYRQGILVLPEIESPGHARAAIKAMERRHLDGDDTYRLIHDGDTSRYTSAQAYHDNVMNPSLEGPYRFMAKVFDELIAMYRDAGVPLPGIHIGGDEVPRGAWDGSDSIRVFMERNGLTDQHQVHAYFVRRVADLLRERNVPMFGWEEIAVGHGDDFNRDIAPLTGGVNVWHKTPKATVKAVRGGYPVILSNVNRFYLDMAYSPHPEEPGLTWGGYVDEFDALGGYLADLCPVDTDTVPGRVIGIQGQLWAETIRCPEDIEYLLLPKMAGMAERAWNVTPTYTEAQFNAIVGDKLLPFYTASAPHTFNARLRPAGIKVFDGKVHMNAPYRGGVIRYTTDGTEPTEQSPVYSAPFTTASHDIRARYYRNGLVSQTTYSDPR